MEEFAMKRSRPPVVKRSIFSWIFPGNIKLQLLLLIIISVTVFARVLPLEMQKRIVNHAIMLSDLDMLLLYCGIYLAAVIAANGLKFLINMIETIISQRTLANMRKDLFEHIITLPLNFYRRTHSGMVVSSLVTELSMAGNFVGMAVSSPVINILTLLAFAVYLIHLNWLLAIVSLAIYPLALLIIPLLQKKTNEANKKRVDVTRDLSSKIGETISGIHEIHGNGSYRIENRKFKKIVDKLYRIRIAWTLYRYAIKSTNNFFTNLGPFLIFLLGGYLTMTGRLELGALVAFLSAQEKLYDPWKELIEFYQVYQDASVSYKRTMSYFNTFPEHALEPIGREPFDLEPIIEAKDLSFMTESGIVLLNKLSFSLKKGEHMALIGFSGSGKTTLALCIAQLHKYTSGNLLLDHKDVTELSKRDMIRNMGFVSQTPFIFSGTILENLLYSCVAKEEVEEIDKGKYLPSLDDMIEVLQQTGLFVDVLRFGLNTVIDSGEHQELVEKIIRVRHNFQENFGKDLSDYVEFYDENVYLFYSSIGENITFGSANLETFKHENLCDNRYFINFLNQADLTTALVSLGAELSRQTVDILGNLPLDTFFFEQSPIKPDEIEDFKILVEDLKQTRLHQLNSQNQRKLLELALRFTPGKHKMVALSKTLERQILEGRALFKEKIFKDGRHKVFTFFDLSSYIHSQTILNNILFGRTTTSSSQAQDKIDQSIIHLLIEEDLLETILEIGMHYQVGTKGENLSGGQRQKLAIARIFLKSPGLMIMDEATSALDNKSQARIQDLLERRWKGKKTVISVAHRLDIVKNYDKIAVMKAGKIIEMGPYNQLMEKKGVFYELVTGKR
jgi:ABC-type multidrug transport system fused ATPase/permease subunit